MIAFWTRRLSGLCFLLFWGNPALATPEVNINSYRTEGSLVTLRITVQENGEPVRNLQKQNFELLVDGSEVQLNNLTPPTASRPAPTQLVILLDVSNSMNEQDNGGTTRIKGATQAIETIINEFEDSPIKINLAPFGKGGGNCRKGNFVPEPVESYLKEENFFLQPLLN